MGNNGGPYRKTEIMVLEASMNLLNNKQGLENKKKTAFGVLLPRWNAPN